MKNVTFLWLKKAIAAAVTGFSSAVLSALGTVAADSVGLNVPALTLKQLGVVALVGGGVGLLAYLKQSPVPPDEEEPPTTPKLPLLLLLIGMAGLVGCQTVEQREVTAYRAIGSTAFAVDIAMQGWGDYVRGGDASDGQQESVRAAYENYQSAMRVARMAVASYRLQPDDATALDTTLIALENASADLIDLVTKLTTK
jgi:hypothetical protein